MNGKTLKMKLTSAALVLAMVVAALGLSAMTSAAAYADTNEITVYVTVSNEGELAATEEGTAAANLPVTVSADENGLATVDAALSAFHETYCPGGYATMETSYGLSVTKLWGVENGGSYLFAIDGLKCNSGVGYDYIGDGQYLTAIVMKDLTYWSDLYAFFDKTSATAKVGEEVELTLAYDEVTYDANWNPTHGAKAVAGANVYVAGGADNVLATTDGEGKAVVSFDEAGTYVVTASGTVAMQVQDWSQGGAHVDVDAPISAPACVITVEADEDETVIDDEPADEEEPASDEEPAVEDEPATEDEPVAEESAEDVENTAEKAPATGDASQMAAYLLVLMAAGATAFVVKKQK